MDAHGHTDHGKEHPTPKTYFIIFAALMLLLILTVAVTYVELGFLNVAVALTIAVIKAVLIILYFMHVRYSSKLVWFFAGASFFWVGIMLGFTFTDYLTRQFLIEGR